MKITHPFKIIDKKLFVDNLLDNLVPKFSMRYKIYYLYLRPVLPMQIRQIMQKVYHFNVSYNKDMIYDDLVEFAREHNDYEAVTKTFYPNGYKSATILTHDVDHQIGFNNIPRILELEEKLGFKSSWNIVPYKYRIDYGIIKLIHDAGHEIGVHGYNHDGKLYSSRKIFDDRVWYINQAIKNFKSVGFRSPMVHHNLEWLQKLDIRYDASCFDYDPFQPFPNSTGLIWPFMVGKFVELPYTVPQDHTLFYVLKHDNIDIWKNKINWLVKNNGMILTLTHPDYLITRKHYNMYKELLEFIKEIPDSWRCLPREMAEWWFEREEEKKMVNVYYNSNGNGKSNHIDKTRILKTGTGK